jgi:amidase
MKTDEYLTYDGLGLAELVKNGEVTALELLETAVEHVENVNGLLNAVVYKQYDLARERIKNEKLAGPFAGVPFLLKDLAAFEVGVPSTFGSEFCKNFIPREESEIVTRFKKAGFVTIGRTNTPEFGLYPTTEPVFRGVTRNPWSSEHSPGGSSGGAAAAVASGMVPIAHAGDGGGSIRIPASCCGVFGLKPTEGRSPTGPSGGRGWHGFVVEHVLSRSVRDSAAVLDIVSARQIGAPILAPVISSPFSEQIDVPLNKLRIAYVEEPFFKAKLHDNCRDAALDAARLCENLGHDVEPHQLNVNSDEVAHAYLVVVAGEMSALLDRISTYLGRKPKPGQLETTTYICALGGRAFSAADYAHAVRVIDEARRSVAYSFEKYDLVLTPTLALPPPKLGELSPKFIEKYFLQAVKTIPMHRLIRQAFRMIPENGFKLSPYTFLFNLTGQPAMSVPLHWNKAGLPIGTHFVGRHGEEGILLRLAKQLDEVKAFSNRRPPPGSD